ncbi:DUF1840 family protein [Azonexus sp. IMCC34839]|uniref:DUF1840 family protein n=1 Tax=Azonexus sp. IMCC34839 TaxID=3133695 RepID=UPI0039994CAB
MLVRFDSSETAEVLMYAETARMLLQTVGKETTARGTFTQPEMAPAAAALRAEAQRAPRPSEDDEEEIDEAIGKRKGIQVGFSQRAWPLIDMLERTAQSGPDAYIIWEAADAF